jgi:hypothetical protein
MYAYASLVVALAALGLSLYKYLRRPLQMSIPATHGAHIAVAFGFAFSLAAKHVPICSN